MLAVPLQHHHRPVPDGGRPVRDHVVVANRHQPTRPHLRRCVTERYELTAYGGEAYGERFDLAEDPGEPCNRREDSACARVESGPLLAALQAAVRREPIRQPRVAGA